MCSRFDARDLWVAVLAQAKEDVEFLPLGSPDYVQAVAFLTRQHGPWAARREEICVILDWDADELSRLAIGWVRARRVREGLPADEPAPAPSAPAPAPPPAPPPAPVAAPEPPVPALMIQGRPKLRRGYNPFMPQMRLERPQRRVPGKRGSPRPEPSSPAA